MLVFRLENEEGKGPFAGAKDEEDWRELVVITGWDPYNGPMGVPDHNVEYSWMRANPDVRFGCPSIEAFNYWFPPVWEKFLCNSGFELKVFEVDDDNVIIGNSGRQCIYRTSDAREV